MATVAIDVAELRPRFRGELITAADGARYDEARKVVGRTFWFMRNSRVAEPFG